MSVRGLPSGLRSGDRIEVDGGVVRLNVNPRARRISLRLDSARREIVATAPSPRRLAEAAAFAERRTDWIAERLQRLPAAAPFAPGATIEVLGAPCRLERAAMRIAPRLIGAAAGEPARLIAYGEAAAFARAIEWALRAEALRALTERTRIHAERLGHPAPQVKVMEARGRWGSCRQPRAGEPARVRYNWRLVLAPPGILDYVAAHESAHLVEANHGPRFWALVGGLYGDPRPARAWLNQHGARLHALGRS